MNIDVSHLKQGKTPLSKEDLEELGKFRDQGLFVPIKDRVGFSYAPLHRRSFFVVNPFWDIPTTGDLLSLKGPLRIRTKDEIPTTNGRWPAWLDGINTWAQAQQFIVSYQRLRSRLLDENKHAGLAQYIETELKNTGHDGDEWRQAS